MNTAPQSKNCPLHPLADERVLLEKLCGVKDLTSIQRKYNSRTRTNGRHVHIGRMVLDSQGVPTLEYWPDEYYKGKCVLMILQRELEQNI